MRRRLFLFIHPDQKILKLDINSKNGNKHGNSKIQHPETPTSNFPPPRYIMVGYNPEHYGSVFIKDEDVVRPPNHKHTNSETPHDWARNRSTARCPTYGSCQICFMCGPVNEYCHRCGKTDRYLCAFYQGHTMDSITLARRMGTGMIRARANRNQALLQTPMFNFTTDVITLAIDRLPGLSQKRKAH